MITLFSNENPSTLAPVCAASPLTDFRLAGDSLGNLLKERWGKIRSADVTAGTAFWPSPLLLERAAEAGGSFLVRSAEGKNLAWSGTGGPPASPETVIETDRASFEIRYPWDLLAVNEELLGQIREGELRGTVRNGATVDGVLRLGEGSVILPGVFIEGVAVVGRDCRIGPNAYLRGFCSIGDGCHIGQAVEIKNSILQERVAAGHLSYIGDSIVGTRVNFGGGTILSNFRHDGRNHRSMVNGELVDTGRRKFGAVLGDGVHTGIHTAIYPGRKLWPGVSTLPGEVVKYDRTSPEP